MTGAYYQWKLLHPAFETVTVEEAFEAGAASSEADAFERGKEAGEQSGFDDGYDQGKSEHRERMAKKLKAVEVILREAVDAN